MRPNSGDPARPNRGFTDQAMYRAASLYYLNEATQEEVARDLGVSRPTVSRLLNEARRRGIVRIEVVRPTGNDSSDLAAAVAEALGLAAARIAPDGTDADLGARLGPLVHDLLASAGLGSGDILLVSSGRTIYEVSRQALPEMPGVLVVPAIGGQDEPEPWYQSNEIVRQVAESVRGTPIFLYAPALPSPELHAVLVHDPSIRRIPQLWEQTGAAILGIGGAPLLRQSIPRFVPTDAISLRHAVGDVCSRFYDRDGMAISFPGVEQLMATPLEVLRTIDTTIAVAAGEQKVMGIVTGARSGYFNRLVTDRSTAELILRHAE